MYIFKNAFTNIKRSKGRNILIGAIITSITIASCITITINKSGHALIKSYKDSNPLKVTLNLDPMNYRNASDEEKKEFNLLDLDTINEIGNLDLIEGYYYTIKANLAEDSISPVSYENLFKKPSNENMPEGEDEGMNRGGMAGSKQAMNSSNFTIIAYSDITYNEDFINGSKKIIEGEMIDNSFEDGKIVISEELATDNNLEIASIVTFKDENDETIIYEYEVVGIYETNSSTTTDPMSYSSSNEIITTIATVNNIKNNDATSSDYTNSSNISAVFYIENDDIDEFTEEVRSLGVSEYYTIQTNEEEILLSLKPIQNIASFSFTFLVVVLIVGAVVLSIINLFNIRERKYEIGVLRAIGMTKGKVTIQLVSEILMVAIISLVIGTCIGTVLTQPVSNMMLASEIESINSQNTQIQENFGGPTSSSGSTDRDFQRPAFNKGQSNQTSNVDYVDTLEVKIDFITLLQLFGVSILLTIVSSTMAVMFVNKYEPNKILQNRN